MDEIDDLARDRGSASSPGAGLPFPEEFEALAMPAHDGLGLYQDEAGAPVFPVPGEENPEEAVALAKPGALHASSKNHELMPEGEVFKGEFGGSPAENREVCVSLVIISTWPWADGFFELHRAIAD
jgi:hypothetical protein